MEHIKLRDWAFLVVCLAYIAVNFWIWSLHPTQMQLLLISAPLGMCAFGAMLWLAMRE